MFRCECCKEVFQEPRIIEESRGEFWGAPAYERVAVCPWCGSDDIDWNYDEEEEDYEV